MTIQHYLITGGTGFIGTALCRQLAAAGHRITVVSRQAASPGRRHKAALPEGPRLVPPPDQIAETDKVDVVVNLAGEALDSGRWNDARKAEFCLSRLRSTQSLVDWMRSRKQMPHTLISASAIGWYGLQGNKSLTETSEPKTGFSHQLCDRWETCAMQARSLGVRVCILRIGIVLERDGGSLARMLLPFKLGLGGPMGDGQQLMSWIHRQDLVNIIEFLANNRDQQGVFNGTAPQPVNNEQFSRSLAKQLGRPAWFRLPAPLLRIVFGEMADELLLNGQCVLPVAATAAGFCFSYPRLDNAFEAILSRPKVHDVAKPASG